MTKPTTTKEQPIRSITDDYITNASKALAQAQADAECNALHELLKQRLEQEHGCTQENADDNKVHTTVRT